MCGPLAFCSSVQNFTEARRSDRHGVVKVLRSYARPEGFGDAEVDEANLIVERVTGGYVVSAVEQEEQNICYQEPLWVFYLASPEHAEV